MKRVYFGIILFGILLTTCKNTNKSNDQIIVEQYELAWGTMYFPSQAPVEEFAGDAAILQGQLELFGECLRLIETRTGTQYLIIWPPGYNVRPDHDPPSILDQNGEFAASLWAVVEIGGGEVSDEVAFESQRPALAETGCGGPYWIASTGPAVTNQDNKSEEILYSSYSLPDEDMLYFPVQPAGNDMMEAQLFGMLIDVDGCLMVEDMYSDTLYLPIWPWEYSLEIEEEIITIVDENGEARVRVGDEVYLSGGEIPGTEESPLGEVVCGGLHWLVGETVEKIED